MREKKRFKSNQAHRVEANAKKKREAKERGLMATGIDQYGKEHQSNNSHER